MGHNFIVSAGLCAYKRCSSSRALRTRTAAGAARLTLRTGACDGQSDVLKRSSTPPPRLRSMKRAGAKDPSSQSVSVRASASESVNVKASQRQSVSQRPSQSVTQSESRASTSNGVSQHPDCQRPERQHPEQRGNSPSCLILALAMYACHACHSCECNYAHCDLRIAVGALPLAALGAHPATLR